MKNNVLVRVTTCVLTLMMALGSVVLPVAQARMIATENAAVAATSGVAGARAALVDELVLRGADPAAAQDRVARLSDAQARQVLAHVDELPAGGGVLAIIGAVVVVLAITDLVGVTDVFPFIDPIG